MPLILRFSLALAAASLLTVLIPAGSASAHDPSCATVYQAAPGIQPVPFGLYDGDFVVDDVHQAGSNNVLCAVDVRVKAGDYGTLSVLVYQGSSDDQAPTTLLAAPVDTFLAPDFGPSIVLHIEMPGIVLPKDSWIGVGWHQYQGNNSPVVVSVHDAVTVGTSHDLFYESIHPAAPQFNDLGSYTANLFLQVYASEPVPARPMTWGQVKDAYR